MGIPSFRNRLEQLCLSRRSSLMNSKNENIRDLWEATKNKNVICDSLLMSHTGKQAKKLLKERHHAEAGNHFLGLSCQGKSAKNISENILPDVIKDWSKHIENLPGHLFNFVRKAMQSQLPTLANLFRWGRETTKECPLCGQIQTNKHVLSNCSNKAALTRYVDRHNKILKLLTSWLSSKLSPDFEIFVDLPDTTFKQTTELFINVRPDLAVVYNKEVFVL